MANVDVSMRDGVVRIVFTVPGKETTEVSMPPGLAAQVGVALMGCVEPEAGSSLLQQVPMLSIHNPSFEVGKSDALQTIIAIQPYKMRPIMIQMDQKQADSFIAALSNR